MSEDIVYSLWKHKVVKDQLNIISDKTIVNAALRNCIKYNVHTLYYDANKAPAQPVTKEQLYKGVVLAHLNSGIGQVSNNLTKLWNKLNPDRLSADLLCYYNNQVINYLSHYISNYVYVTE